MKLRTVVIATLLSYAQFFREGDNEYSGSPYIDSLMQAVSMASRAGGGRPIGEPGAWLVFERLILLRYQNLSNQGRSKPPARTMAQTPKPPSGWVAMTMPAFLRALA